jgi:hypothetical protein
MAGTLFGLFAWAGGLGGFSTISGVDIHQAMDYRRKWRWYPTNRIPVEDWEKSLGRKVYRDDFKDIIEIFGEDPEAIPTYPTDVVGIVPTSKPDQQWWKDVLQKAREAEEKNEK